MHVVAARAFEWRRVLMRCAAVAVCAVYVTQSAAQSGNESRPPTGTGVGAPDAFVTEPIRDDLAGKLARREVQRSPSSIPDREIVQVVTEIPAGIESGWHVHPGEEVGYIIVGSIEMRVRGRPATLLRPGDGFLIPPQTPHNARDLGPETGQMLSTYIVETGQPLAAFVDAPPSPQ